MVFNVILYILCASRSHHRLNHPSAVLVCAEWCEASTPVIKWQVDFKPPVALGHSTSCQSSINVVKVTTEILPHTKQITNLTRRYLPWIIIFKTLFVYLTLSIPLSLSLSLYVAPIPGVKLNGPDKAFSFSKKSSYFVVSGSPVLSAFTVAKSGVPGKAGLGHLYIVFLKSQKNAAKHTHVYFFSKPLYPVHSEWGRSGLHRLLDKSHTSQRVPSRFHVSSYWKSHQLVEECHQCCQSPRRAPSNSRANLQPARSEIHIFCFFCLSLSINSHILLHCPSISAHK